MIKKGSIRARMLGGLAVVALVAVACSSSGGSTAPSGGAASYKIGFANGGGVGNGWRESSICSVKAQAAASGKVSAVTVINHDTDAAGQLTDIRDLIAKDVDAIIINPNDPDALNPAIDEAIKAGIKVVAIDAFVTAKGAYNLSNDQVQYAYLGAKALFEQMGKKGAVVYMRGIAGHPADTDRDTGFKNVLKDYPDIKVLPSADGVATDWAPATATKLINEFIASGQYDSIQGIWTSGIDSEVVDAIKAAKKPFVPIVGTDRGSFTAQLLDATGYPDLKGAAVTNTAAVGGAGVALALKLLKGEAVETDPSASQPNTVLLVPVIADNLTDAGKATLDSWQSVPGLTPTWPLGLEIPGWTTYTPEQAVACKGPGE
jgi:ribose transport system substrate-binding protein